MPPLVMKKLLGIIVLAGAALLGYRWFVGWRAVNAYEKFADAWTHDDRVAALEHAGADMVDAALGGHPLTGMPSGSILEAFRGTSYEIETKTRLPGGNLRLEVRQTIFFDPPGATTAIGGAMATHIHHSATLRKTAEGWKVVAFEPKYLDMGTLRRR
jgi:hypothetical protein